MKDKKELLEQTIKEDLEKEAQEILKALETSDVDELSDEKQIELKKKIDCLNDVIALSLIHISEPTRRS